MPQEVRGVMVRQSSGQGDEQAKGKVLLLSVGRKLPGAEWGGWPEGRKWESPPRTLRRFG